LLSVENKDAGVKFYNFVANWVLTHIAKADKIWANYVKSKE
jgi:hemerythrin